MQLPRRSYRALLVGLVCTAACGGTSTKGGPTSPTPVTSVSGSTVPFAIELPIAPGDSASLAYGIWPFGVHGGGHALDGHAGFDIEYRTGAPVLAATDGIVDTIAPDAHDPLRRNIQLRHVRDRGAYVTGYSNLLAVPERIVTGATVAQGEVLGVAGSFRGGESAMIHFQVGDPNHFEYGMIITSPVEYFTPASRARLDEIWRTAAYIAELCEPFLTNSRAHGFPFNRTWTLKSGSGPSKVEVTCPADGVDPQYVLTLDGSTIESGTLSVGWNARPTTLDFRPASGASRLALYDIVSDTMQLAMGVPGAARPASFAGAAVYTTR